MQVALLLTNATFLYKGHSTTDELSLLKRINLPKDRNEIPIQIQINEGFVEFSCSYMTTLMRQCPVGNKTTHMLLRYVNLAIVWEMYLFCPFNIHFTLLLNKIGVVLQLKDYACTK